jgi:hypothetical protein
MMFCMCLVPVTSFFCMVLTSCVVIFPFSVSSRAKSRQQRGCMLCTSTEHRGLVVGISGLYLGYPGLEVFVLSFRHSIKIHCSTISRALHLPSTFLTI